jgi:hypothetical protein
MIATVDRYQKAQKLYDVMIRHYCHIFRGTLSPYDEHWKLEGHAAVLGNNRDLIEKFEAFKLVEEDQCELKSRPYDVYADQGSQAGIWIQKMTGFI